MRLVNRSDGCVIKLEDKVTGELFAKCPIDKYPGVALEAVTDSSRYFVLRIQDEGGEQSHWEFSVTTFVDKCYYDEIGIFHYSLFYL